MKKFEFGLFALCILIGGQVGSMFGIAITICAYMMLSGIIDEVRKQPKQVKKESKEEAK